jgi:hypothetical protein
MTNGLNISRADYESTVRKLISDDEEIKEYYREMLSDLQDMIQT